MKLNSLHIVAFSALLSLCFAANAIAQQPTGWKAHDKNRPQAEVVDPGNAEAGSHPSDAIVLFSGKDLSQWEGPNGSEPGWKVNDGVMACFKGAKFLYTKEKFSDIQLHLEWASPAGAKGKGQGRGNSGVFLPGGVEIQVLDSYQNDTYADGHAASVYGQFPPLVNVCRGPGEWQSYDIIYQMPRFNEQGEFTKSAVVTVLQNGVLVHHATEVLGPTEWVHHTEFDPKVTEGTISLQDHGNPVRFRNIWVRKLETERAPGEYPERRAFTEQELKTLPGKYKRNVAITAVDDKLWFHFRGGQAIEMAAYADGTLGAVESAGSFDFDFNEDGSVKKMDFRFDAGYKGSVEPIK